MVPVPPDADAPLGVLVSPPQASRANRAPAPRPMPSRPRRLRARGAVESDRWVRMRAARGMGYLGSSRLVVVGRVRGSGGRGVAVGGDGEPEMTAQRLAL